MTSSRIKVFVSSRPKGSKSTSKDIWDKFNTISGVISGLLVAVVGFYATQIYDKRSRDLEQAEKERNTTAIELQTIEKFFSHLGSAEGAEKMAAIEVVGTISNGALAKIANAYRGPSARAALMTIANGASGGQKELIDSVLTDLYRRDSAYVYAVNGVTCGGFVVSDDGRLLTAAHCIPQRSKDGASPCVQNLNIKKSDLYIRRGDQSRQFSASLITWDDSFDIALLKIDVADKIPAGRLSSGDDFGADIAAISVTSPEGEIRAVSGRLSDYSSDRLRLTASFASGFAGSPLVNSDGLIVGMMTIADSAKAVGVSNGILKRLMQSCGN